MKTKQNNMKVFLTMLLGFSALSVHATSAQRFNVAAAEAGICEVDDLVPTAMAHEGQALQYQQFRTAKSSDKEHEFTWKEVTTTVAASWQRYWATRRGDRLPGDQRPCQQRRF